jgi:DNA helicase-2/ATP-dependent DNA helicase PcrA
VTALTPEQQSIIEEETRVLAETLASLRSQAEYAHGKFESEQDRSRDLNSQIVASYRAEERALLASDEAVAHALSQKKREDLKHIQKLLKKPYFGRILVEEARGGRTSRIEYKLGLIANPDCRIVDWRSAPISKLYYEYQEGDTYEEEILGAERVGVVLMRRILEIDHGVLRSIQCNQGTFVKKGAEWSVSHEAHRITKAGSASTLADVLPMVTPEQFRAITEDAETAILIQGVAGSGKTTVALHRLAWLIRERGLAPKDCAVILFSEALRRYIFSLLPSLELEGVSVILYSGWAESVLRSHLPQCISPDGGLRRPDGIVPHTLLRAKRTMALLDVIESIAILERENTVRAVDSMLQEPSIPASLSKLWRETSAQEMGLVAALHSLRLNIQESIGRVSATHALFSTLSSIRAKIEEILRTLPTTIDIYISALSRHKAILERDDSRLLSLDILKETESTTVRHLKTSSIDRADESIILRILQVRGGEPSNSPLGLPRFKHLVADEVQDYTPANLATLVAAVEHPWQLTLVGDVAQSIHDGGSFPGWDRLKSRWRLKDSISRSIALTVSYRSTLPIMKLADSVLGRSIVTEGRSGRVPLLFKAETEDLAIEAAIKWLEKGLELYPSEMSAVLCVNASEARQLTSFLKPRFNHGVRYADASNFTFEAGLVVTTTQVVKGLEFANVLIWNPDRDTFPKNSEGQSLLHVAITRAFENLCFVSYRRVSDLLPSDSSGLIRVVRLKKPEPERESPPPGALDRIPQ